MPDIPTYPFGSVYQGALQNTARCFKDPVLKAGSPITDARGFPKPISGNFASVFTIRAADGKRWAVKCFTRYVADQEIRYQRISETLADVNKPWRVAFEYEFEGILCEGKWFPILKMEWIEATGLIPFIEKHLWQPPVLADLASKFASMVSDLEHLGVAHGDLQHGNLLVTPTRELKLIDYDGMFVAGLTQLGASENGHANYQSPSRTMSSWSSNLDHFSAWLIYGSLLALTIDPMLWTLLHQEGDEALLFHKEDFLDPANSRALMLLSQCVDERLRALGEVLSPYMSDDLGNIPALSIATLPAPNKQQSFFDSTSSHTSNSTAPGGEVLQGIADWLNSIDEGSTGVTINDPSWVLSHMPTIEPVHFQPTNRALRVCSFLWMLSLVVMAVLGATAVIPGLVVGTVVGVLSVVIATSSAMLFRRTSEFESKREVRERFKQHRMGEKDAKRAVSQSEKNRRSIDQRERRALETIEKRANDARTSETKELSGVESSLAVQMSKLGAQRQSLQAAESNETANTLRALQQQYLSNLLRTNYIRSASIQGIGQGLQAALASRGVTTAYDFTGFVFGERVLIVLRSGQRFHVSGIGEAKARALDSWRRGVEARARTTQPAEIPQVQAQAIKLKYAELLHALVQSEQRFRAECTTQRIQIQDRWKVTHASLALELSQTRQSFLPERARGDLQLSSALREEREASWRQVSGSRELSSYSEVTFARYCSCVIKG
jgi:hypothetical protein